MIYSVEDRTFAEKQGRIFDDVQPNSLHPGTYTFAITKDGCISYGQVVDGWEFGVKHLHIANGRSIVAAGEFEVSGHGTYAFNIDSNTFVKPLIQEKGAKPQILIEGIQKAFEAYGIRGIPYEDRVILPDHPPSKEEMELLCHSTEFLESNARFCVLPGRDAKPPHS